MFSDNRSAVLSSCAEMEVPAGYEGLPYGQHVLERGLP